MSDERDIKIDAKLLAQYLQACASDDELKAQMMDEISEKMGLPPEKVELVLDAALKILRDTVDNSARLN